MAWHGDHVWHGKLLARKDSTHQVVCAKEGYRDAAAVGLTCRAMASIYVATWLDIKSNKKGLGWIIITDSSLSLMYECMYMVTLASLSHGGCIMVWESSSESAEWHGGSVASRGTARERGCVSVGCHAPVLCMT